MTLLFAGMLGLNRLYVADEEQGGFDGFLLAPVDRTWLFVAKALALLAYLVVLEIVAVPAFALLLLGPGIDQALPELRRRPAAGRHRLRDHRARSSARSPCAPERGTSSAP